MGRNSKMEATPTQAPQDDADAADAGSGYDRGYDAARRRACR